MNKIRNESGVCLECGGTLKNGNLFCFECTEPSMTWNEESRVVAKALHSVNSPNGKSGLMLVEEKGMRCIRPKERSVPQKSSTQEQARIPVI